MCECGVGGGYCIHDCTIYMNFTFRSHKNHNYLCIAIATKEVPYSG